MAGLWTYMIRDDRCLRCGKCMGACPLGAILIPQGQTVTTTTGIVSIDVDLCNACGECVSACKLRAIAKKLKPHL